MKDEQARRKESGLSEKAVATLPISSLNSTFREGGQLEGQILVWRGVQTDLVRFRPRKSPRSRCAEATLYDEAHSVLNTSLCGSTKA